MRKYFSHLILVPIFCASFITIATAAEADPPIVAKGEVNRAFITIGDPIEYTVTIRHTPDIQILSSIAPTENDILKIKKVEDINRKEKKRIVTGRKFTLTSFQLGEFILGPELIQYRMDGKDPQTIETEKIYITVRSVAEGEDKTDIKGTKGVLDIHFNARPVWIATLILATLIIAFIIWRLNQKNPGFLKPAEPPMSAEEEAIKNLNTLFDSDLLRRDKVKEYYLRFSEVLKIYIEKRFKFLAQESTTYEIKRSLREKEVDGALREKISEVLEASDLAKFAKWKPEPIEVMRLNQKAIQIIEQARPKEMSQNGV